VSPTQGSELRHRRVEASDRPIPQVALGIDRPEKDAVLLAFGHNLRSLRATASLSQGTLAARCFLRRDHISGLERGIRAPTLTVLLTLADALGSTVDELTGDLPAPTRHQARTRTLAEIASHPGIRTNELASALGVPRWYMSEILRYLESTGAVTGPISWTTTS
jgi:transcriptional regulator with XRE-family HTH domain